MQTYEITFLTRSEDADGGVANLIGQLDGRIENQLPPVRRKLAYPIKKEAAAVYYTYLFQIEPNKLAELNQKLAHNNDVLRHLVIADGIRKQPEAPARKLKEKDLEVAESVTKGTAEFKAQEEAARAAEATAEAQPEVVTEPIAAETVEETAAEKPTETPAPTEEVTAEELTSEERQKKLDEKLKSILGE